MSLKYYTIFGERNSGTKYLKEIIDYNFKLEFTQRYGFKHWFIKDLQPRGAANTSTDYECQTPLSDESVSETLFVFCVRNPLDWIESMFRNPYYINFNRDWSISQFIRHRLDSCSSFPPTDYAPGSAKPWIANDSLGCYFIEGSENIVTLRNEKNNHFFALKHQVKYFYIVRQEQILNDLSALNNTLQITSNKIKLFAYRQPQKYTLLTEEDKKFIFFSLNNIIDYLYYI